VATVGDDVVDELLSEDAPDRYVEAVGHGQWRTWTGQSSCSYRSTTNIRPFHMS
jgi:hypothetical protein